MTRAVLRRTAALLLTASVTAACGLPVDGGVHSPGPVAGDAQEPAGAQALPPGPQDGDGPREIVQGFLRAQSSPTDDHALAREFLHPEIRADWSDDRVLVRTPALDVAVDPADESRVVVRIDVVAEIDADGSHQLKAQPRLPEEYRLGRDDAGQLRLIEVPPGLRLTPRDANSSFEPQNVYFLRAGASGGLPRLVPDRVFLPVDTDPAEALVRSLLAGPSSALTAAVTTAVPEGTELRQPVRSDDGVVTVDLTGPLDTLSVQARQQLSAQLVWTLRGAGQVFTSLRLLHDGRPLQVDGAGQVQDRDAWPAYDPTRPEQDGTLLLVREGRLAAIGGGPPTSEATDGRLPVAAGVASPSTGSVALLSSSPEGDVVRIGPARGPFEVALQRGPVGSLSWGAGDAGLFVVEGGADPQVLLLPAAGAAPVPVPHVRPEGAGPLASVRVSRDGARVAAVFGVGAERQVLVGRVERASDGLHMTGFRPVAPSLTDVADAAWESPTSLIVLGSLGTANRLPVRVAVDGSELDPVRTLGLDGEPQAVTAAPGQPLVVGTRLGDRSVLFVEESGLFREPVPGAAPAYPG